MTHQSINTILKSTLHIYRKLHCSFIPFPLFLRCPREACFLFFCVPPFSFHLHLQHAYRTSCCFGTDILSCWALAAQPLPSSLSIPHSFPQHLFVLLVQQKLHRVPVTGLPFMTIPLGLFLTFHSYWPHPLLLVFFQKASWTAKLHTPALVWLLTSLSLLIHTQLWHISSSYSLMFPFSALQCPSVFILQHCMFFTLVHTHFLLI